MLKNESDVFGDILQEMFVDSYTNLTVKSLMMLKWFTTNCRGRTTYLMKTDEDVYVNLDNLVKVLGGASGDVRGVMGHLYCSTASDKVRQKKGYKVYLKDCMFPNVKRETFAAGPAYVMDIATADIIYRTAFDMQALAFEDLFLTGIVAKKANIKPMHNSDFYTSSKKSTTRKKLKDMCFLSEMVAAH